MLHSYFTALIGVLLVPTIDLQNNMKPLLDEHMVDRG